jgi:hypothetical protein
MDMMFVPCVCHVLSCLYMLPEPSSSMRFNFFILSLYLQHLLECSYIPHLNSFNSLLLLSSITKKGEIVSI